MNDSSAHPEKVRIDKLLWYLRLAKTRSAAQQMVRDGHIRVDRARATSAHLLIGIGQTVTITAHDRMHVIRLVEMPHRRGPAAEARACYVELVASQAIDVPVTIP